MNNPLIISADLITIKGTVTFINLDEIPLSDEIEADEELSERTIRE